MCIFLFVPDEGIGGGEPALELCSQILHSMLHSLGLVSHHICEYINISFRILQIVITNYLMS